LQAPIATALRPGFSESHLDLVAERLGVALPHELRELWAWHDGADPDSRSDIGPGGYQFLTTDEVVAAHAFNRSIHAESPAPDLIPELFWHRTWIPFMRQDAQRLYIDAERTTQTWESPVRLVTWEWENFEVDRAPSLAAAVSMWTWLLESDHYRWDENGHGQQVDYRSVPLFARETMA
jgi:cell wall assembly regulator SMI1